MRIDVKSVSVKNFLSYGNSNNTYDFENGLDIIIASNGAGKSSITLDALMFGFFGKPYRKIKLNSLQNQINKKDLLVKIIFNKNDDQYEIHRGLNPSIFKIFKNDVLIDELANTRDYQKMLEETIIETSEKTFRNLIVLGGVGITSGFMDLSASEKEELVSNIIDIKLINQLIEKIKEKTQSLKTQKTELSYKVNLISDVLKTDIERYKTLSENNTKENHEQEIKELETELTKLSDILVEIDDINSKLEKAENSELKLKQIINDSNNKISIFKNSKFVCEKCGFENNKSGINYEETQANLAKAQDNLDILKSKIDILRNKKDDLSVIKNDLKSKEQVLNNLKKLSEKNTTISEAFIIDLKESIKTRKAELDTLRGELSGVLENLNKYQEMIDLLGKNNIKKYIINQQIPFLNKKINEFLQLFFTNYSFYFDSQLKDKVFFKNIEQDYNQLSNGQKIRICFSIMFAFIKFLEQKNGTQWNILILDEALDSSLDAEGIESLISVILKEFTNKNIVLVSHNDEIKNMDIFNRKVTISKSNFSNITFEKMDGNVTFM